MEGLQRLLVALGADESPTLRTAGDLLSFFDRIRNTIRDNKNQANGLIDINILRELSTAITTTDEPIGANEEIVEMVIRCMINAMCDSETATTIFVQELHGISVLVTLLHRTKTSSIAYQITKLIYMMISQYEKVVMSSLLCWQLDVSTAAACAATTLPSNDTSNVVNNAPITIADVFITHLEQCLTHHPAMDIVKPPLPPSDHTHPHSSSDDNHVYCSGECTFLLLSFATSPTIFCYFSCYLLLLPLISTKLHHCTL